MKNKQPLTPRQQQLLEVIRQQIAKRGIPPSIREMKEAIGVNSLRGVTIHLDGLEEKGYIERSRQARSIRILNPGQSGAEDDAFVTPVPYMIPVVGQIAAGQPLLAEQHVEERLAVDPRWVPGPGCFAVRVRGESMINAGINDGDYVMVRPQQDAQNGEVVAVLIEGEATVKRFYREKNGMIRLQPENPAMEPMIYNPKNQSIRLIGKVAGLFRKF